MSTAPKRCHYEVIGLPQTCTQDEIRSAYKKLALQRHPDKLVQSGVSSSEATSAFQELVHAYEVLSDQKERQWYDSHRSQILFSDLARSDASSPAGIPNLFSYFSPSCYTDFTDSKKGFYKVYSDVFDKIFANEINFAKTLGLGLGSVKEAPVMGDLKSPYTQANAFYGYWLSFTTVMDFGWVDKWDASAGENRKTRRLMEEDNKKIRKKARREFNETVRGLAEFVKKRDKRVIDMMVKKEKEREKKRQEELEKRKKMEREKLEKAKMYEDPEWARVQEDDILDFDEEDEEEEEEKKELYCVACKKKFKSDKQWKNHEKSKKHKEKVEELKASFAEEDENFGVESDELDEKLNEELESNAGDSSFQSAEDAVSELEEEFKDGLSVQEEENGDELPSGTEVNDVKEPNMEEDEDLREGESIQEEESGDELPSGTEDNKSIESDDETRILKAMLSGHKSKRHGTVKRQQPESPPMEKARVDSEDEIEVVMEYNNSTKSSRKSRRAKGVKAKNTKEAAVEVNGDDNNSPNEENGMRNNEGNYEDNMKYKGSKSDRFAKTKNSSRSTKHKGKTRQSDPACEQCGEEFESRTKLHKHLKDTGHASLKSR
ncbi:hypothetical protein V2J09_014925 [Rumex salicifolius]